MKNVKTVLDTNILVSALWSKDGNPAKIVSMIFSGEIVNYYSDETLAEYRDVLFRKKFVEKFSRNTLEQFLNNIVAFGEKTIICKSDVILTDEDDRVFYDTATIANAYLVTGNMKHFPDEPFILTPAQFLEKLQKARTLNENNKTNRR